MVMQLPTTEASLSAEQKSNSKADSKKFDIFCCKKCGHQSLLSGERHCDVCDETTNFVEV